MSREREELKFRIKSLISIPEYYKKYIDRNIDLNKTPKVASPFRNETRPSFSYSIQKGIWKDFGGKKEGGDVISLHKAWRKFRTYDEAMYSLAQILSINVEKILTFDIQTIELKEAGISEKYKILNKRIETKLRSLNNPRTYCDYDDIMIMSIPIYTKYKLMEQFYESIC